MITPMRIRLAGSLLSLLMFSVPLMAQQPKGNHAREIALLTIKGHHLGETLQEFLQSEPEIQAQDKEVVEVANTGTGSIPGSTREDGDWLFEDGNLCEIKLLGAGDHYRQIRDDLSKRIGVKPISERRVPMHNAHGAAWVDLLAVWLTPELHAHLEGDWNPESVGTFLVVESRAAYDKKRREEKAKPSPLD